MYTWERKAKKDIWASKSGISTTTARLENKNIVCGLSNLNITYRFLQNFDPVEILILFNALGALKKNIKE